MFKTLSPAFTSRAIPIVFSSSEPFAPYCYTAILSLIDHINTKDYYDIIVLDTGMSPDTKEVYKQLLKGYNNVSIRFHSVSDVLSEYALTGNHWWTVDCYARLLIPDLLPDYHKAIYLDGDQIILDDVAKLFNIDISNASIGACRDVGSAAAFHSLDKLSIMQDWFDYTIETVKIKKENFHKYFSSSTMLMNLTRIREKYTHQQLLQYAEEKNFNSLDVQVFNSLFQDDVQMLPLAWGWLATEGDTGFGGVYKHAPGDVYKEYLDAGEAPKVIHYGGADKPWDHPARARAEEFWRVFRRTPYYAISLEERLREVQEQVTSMQAWQNRMKSSHPYRFYKKLKKIFKR